MLKPPIHRLLIIAFTALVLTLSITLVKPAQAQLYEYGTKATWMNITKDYIYIHIIKDDGLYMTCEHYNYRRSNSRNYHGFNCFFERPPLKPQHRPHWLGLETNTP